MSKSLPRGITDPLTTNRSPIQAITIRLGGLMGPIEAYRWINAGSPMLGGLRPLDFIREGAPDKVAEVIDYLEAAGGDHEAAKQALDSARMRKADAAIAAYTEATAKMAAQLARMFRQRKWGSGQ